MDTGRLAAFSDGVLAIIITIMVLELKVPEGHTFEAIRPLVPVLFSYVLSFLYVGIYWNNHHHLLHTVKTVTGAILWANLHLLFWLSLLPFATGWMGAHPTAFQPTMVYGAVLLMAAIAYWLLQKAIMAAEGEQSLLRTAVGRDWKGNLSPILYIMGITTAFWSTWLSQAIYTAVALIWVIPDKRIERALGNDVTPPTAQGR